MRRASSGVGWGHDLPPYPGGGGYTESHSGGVSPVSTRKNKKPFPSAYSEKFSEK